MNYDGIYGFENSECRFLSNFYPVEIIYRRIKYPTSEHAYQASKCSKLEDQIRISQCPTPSAAKRLGRELKIKPYWDLIKLDIMREILQIKFSIPEMREKLLATENLHLEETNWWGDTFWGVCRGVGQNHLGKILMEIRGNIQR